MTKFRKLAALLLVTASALGGLTACEKGPAEKAGAEVDDAMERAGDALEDAADDIEEAEAICRELGLGDVLERMPAGLLQMVGETGWQLSHGEKSRLYIARALLQEAKLIVLDESFAALDPETLRHSLSCVLERASTLRVIAHP